MHIGDFGTDYIPGDEEGDCGASETKKFHNRLWSQEILKVFKKVMKSEKRK